MFYLINENKFLQHCPLEQANAVATTLKQTEAMIDSIFLKYAIDVWNYKESFQFWRTVVFYDRIEQWQK